MKAINFIIIGVMALALLISCRKEALTPVAHQRDDSNVLLRKMEKLLDGKLFKENLKVQEDDAQIVLYGDKQMGHIFIQKIAGSNKGSLSPKFSAVVITSPYGLIIKDLQSDKISLLSVNDTESTRRFEKIAAVAGASTEKVFGITIVQPEKIKG